MSFADIVDGFKNPDAKFLQDLVNYIVGLIESPLDNTFSEGALETAIATFLVSIQRLSSMQMYKVEAEVNIANGMYFGDLLISMQSESGCTTQLLVELKRIRPNALVYKFGIPQAIQNIHHANLTETNRTDGIVYISTSANFSPHTNFGNVFWRKDLRECVRSNLHGYSDEHLRRLRVELPSIVRRKRLAGSKSTSSVLRVEFEARNQCHKYLSQISMFDSPNSIFQKDLKGFTIVQVGWSVLATQVFIKSAADLMTVKNNVEFEGIVTAK